jgi:hypothetical protein
LTDPPQAGEQVALIQAKALRAYGVGARERGVVVNGVYDAATSAWVKFFQEWKTNNGNPLPRNPTAAKGDCDYATKVALGLIPSAAVVPKPPGAVIATVPGTWAGWNDGPPAWTAWRCAPKFWQQGVQYPAMGFLSPDPQVSYNESRDVGIGELLRLSLPDPRPKVWVGYSQGADVVTRALHAWPADRRHEIVYVVKFGDPGQAPGVDGSVNGGIAKVYTPEWVQARTKSYLIKGDMYGDAPGLLPFGYDVLTRLEISGEFVFFLFGLLTGIPVGGSGGGLGGLDIGGILGGLGGLVGGVGGLAGGPLGGILGGGLGSILGGGLGGILGGGGLGASTAPLPTAAPNALGQQLLGLGGGSGIPGFGMFSNILGLVTPGAPTQTGGPISLLAMLMNIPAIIQTLMALLQFVMTNAHMKYGGAGSEQIFNGTDAVIDAANRINAISLA